MIDWEKIRNEAKSDLKVDESSIISSSMNSGIIITKWLDYYKQTAISLNKVKSEKESIELLLYLYYSGKASLEHLELLNKTKPFGLKIDTKSDIEKFIKASKEYIKITEKLVETEQFLKFIDEVIQALKFQNNKIGNIIAYQKFLAGE